MRLAVISCREAQAFSMADGRDRYSSCSCGALAPDGGLPDLHHMEWCSLADKAELASIEQAKLEAAVWRRLS